MQSVRRAIGMLDCFGAGDVSLSLSDLLRRMGLSTSTTHRLARTLTVAGLLEQEARTGRYRLGPSITELGQLSLYRRGLHRCAPSWTACARPGTRTTTGSRATGIRTVAVPVLDRQGHARYALAVRSTPLVMSDARVD